MHQVGTPSSGCIGVETADLKAFAFEPIEMAADEATGTGYEDLPHSAKVVL